MEKSCCFIGHRKINETEELKKEIHDYAEYLILNENVKRFLFGSRSDFDSFCHGIVTGLKEKYPFIKRVGYTCKSETVVLEREKEKTEQVLSRLFKREIRLLGMEEEIEHKNKYTAGKGAYIERNQAMIDDSDYCVFYYDENYLPPKKVESLGYYRLRSGTAAAYKYAKRKKKSIKNFFK